uniref:Uncharacterized protein n=1 Tax=Pseudo-nitzschia australis TaxID=44445 RepID=A0A7S4EQ01_9STRA|mmetsp:Transcript_27823/g.61272  ORF Transcript_27823/g.61272 Transcript_27823/m.61272 type:complete len:266 (-) Transcript_27823:705-1502(-)|eukprot:CAMPEP_0168178848 /NCGR_PEP_ID=MMETSP0139_2-20121125/9427_1 /TAXON_ID=44445 /ORGANISM="Pseudo-nitzschia australis, Strain 10249 10 AB" /LENGTH=265 /DNA_ID=CAMNT_0008098435 /DNA_START=86 /DNA_END=883 /DNA_ORIENTATION=+
MAEKNWRETLYIWDGIVTAGMPSPTTAPEDDSAPNESTPIPLLWKGSWVPMTGVPDATKAEAPKRNAFKRDIDAECNFEVQGIATPTKGEDGNVEQFLVAKLTEGTGWEMKDDEKKEVSHYKDESHDVLVKTIRWSGNQKDETESLIVAKGQHSEFGAFCSVGWMRPGCRWTLARRYLSEDDPRIKWSLNEFYKVVVKESINVGVGGGTAIGGDVETKKTTEKRLLHIPPWQAPVMHADFDNKNSDDSEESEDGGGKRKRVSKDQ